LVTDVDVLSGAALEFSGGLRVLTCGDSFVLLQRQQLSLSGWKLGTFFGGTPTSRGCWGRPDRLIKDAETRGGFFWDEVSRHSHPSGLRFERARFGDLTEWQSSTHFLRKTPTATVPCQAQAAFGPLRLGVELSSLGRAFQI